MYETTAMIELFAGPGGIGCAAERLGIPSAGIEWDCSAVATRRAAGLNTIHDDVRNHGPQDFPNASILAAGPPCQTFTLTGNGSGRKDLQTVLDAVRAMGNGAVVDLRSFDDERTGLVLEPLRWILEAHATGHAYKSIVLEQVPQALPVWDAYADVLRGLGYGVDTGVLRTEQYGVPQTRKRAVLVARSGRGVTLPEPTHHKYVKGLPSLQGPYLKPWVSMADVLGRSEFGPFEAVSNYGTGGDPKNRGRRRSDEPSATVTGKISRVRVVDGYGESRFSNSEAGVLQGFPHDWPWSGTGIAQQIGNACPVQLAYALLWSVTS